MSWVGERRSDSCKCNSNCVSLGILGARSDDSCGVRLCNWHGAGEQNATVRLRRGILQKRPLTGMMVTEGGGGGVWVCVGHVRGVPVLCLRGACGARACAARGACVGRACAARVGRVPLGY